MASHRWEGPRLGMNNMRLTRCPLSLDSFNAEFIRLCNRMDEIWVPSKFSFDTLVKSGRFSHAPPMRFASHHVRPMQLSYLGRIGSQHVISMT